MQPQQRGEAADGGDFRAQVGADDIGVDHGFADHPAGLTGLDRQGAEQDPGHVVHHRRQQCGEHAGAQGGGPEAGFAQLVEGQCQVVGQPGIFQPVHHQVHAQRECHHLPGRFA